MKMGDWIQLAFIVLKLCGVIEWSWFWVLLPYEICLGAVVLARIIDRFGD